MDASDTPEDLPDGAGEPQEMEYTSSAGNDVELSGKIEENQTDSTKAESIVIGDDENDQQAEVSSTGSSPKPEVDASSPESDSSSDSEEDEVAPPDFMQELKSNVAKHFTSETFFETYTQRLERRAKNKNRNDEAPTLVKGLVDYMRTLEERISSLEDSRDAESEAETDSNSAATSEDSQSEVHLDARFFNAAAYLGDEDPFPDHDGERGTFSRLIS